MKARTLLLKDVIITCFLCLLLPGQFNHAQAQNATVLAVEPSTISVPLGNRVQLTLDVIDGLDVNGFDLMINYDQERLSLIDWKLGDYLFNLTCTNLVRQPGVFELACSQVAQQEVNGDGVLLEFTFDTLGLGSPDVTITEGVLIDSLGGISYPERRNGLIEVRNDPTYTSTPTITYTPTQTRTPTQSLSLTSTSLPTTTQTWTPFSSPTINQTPSAIWRTSETVFPTEMSSATMALTSAYPRETVTYVPTIPIPGAITEQIETQTPTSVLIDNETSPDDMAQNRSESLVKDLWRTTLWGVLIIAVLAAAVIIFGFVRQKRQTADNEDLLL